MHLSNAEPETITLKSKRVDLVDILRAVALFGIIVNHITMSFLAGPPPPDNPSYNIFSPMDGAFNAGSMMLTFGKFFTIFSFLFGLSFAIQMDSSEKKGGFFGRTFLWRITILFIIGYIHNLFFSGDILVVYAVLGFLLLAFRNVSSRIILPLALLLILNIPGLVKEIIGLSSLPMEMTPEAQQQIAGFKQMAQEQYRIKAEGSLMEVIRMNAVDGMAGKLFFQVISGRLWITFGLFLLGLYAGRKKIFETNQKNQQFFKRLLVWSGAVAVVSTVLSLKYGTFLTPASTPMQVLGNFAFSVHQGALSAFYVSLVALIYWKARSKQFLNMLAPAGRMGLTTYLVQSVFGVLLYYGFGLGLMGNIGVTASIAIGVGFFALQVVIAKWWMSHFRFGPVEWLWRSLTYLKWQSMKKERRIIVIEKSVAPAEITYTKA